MATRYWVGGDDVWDSTAGGKWVTTSAGRDGASVPTKDDGVYLYAPRPRWFARLWRRVTHGD